ncbi:chemotaxis protein CheW [Methylobacterium sp. J-070]|uniref:chemotaxis protein CheW n=1 Tax=Methylobacterium sp. J-070 TaxID=2836650 RepID=UPI001FBB3A85|nr:chemotaxis protein CheW [Methylobacterium sp. J-070]MCJ2050895.1 chemotaxis protein CheW [Methylobacterium sp. J-070]
MEPRPSAQPSAQEGRPPARPERDLRAERAAALARRAAAGARSDAGVDHLVCVCGDERYGLPMAAVAQVLPMRPCTPVPGAVPALIGLVALSGRIVGVLGLARALGRPDAAPDALERAGHLVVLRGAHGAAPPSAQPAAAAQLPSRPVAFAVDRVLGIARVADPAAAPPGAADRGGLGNESASGYAPGSGGNGRPDFVVIDLPRLLRRTLP